VPSAEGASPQGADPGAAKPRRGNAQIVFPWTAWRAYRGVVMDQRARTAARRHVALAGDATAWRAEHEANVRALARRRLLIAGSLFLGLHLLGFAVFRPAQASAAELWLRAVVVPLTLAVMGLAWRDRAARRALGFSVALLVLLAAYIVWTNSVQGNPTSVPSLIILVMGSGVLFPLTPRLMGLVAGATLGFFLVGAFASSAGSAMAITASSFYLVAAGALATVGAALGTSLRLREHGARAEVERSREVAERLLLNTLPGPIVDRLKESPGAIADGYDEATVLFADLAGFTPLSERLEPAELVEMLDGLFSSFDALCEEHGCEKIKTMGDAYMAVAGVPTRRDDHAVAIAKLALAMREEVGRLPLIRDRRLGVRIGINTGPIIAGVIGTKKFTYDIWGDAVNVAARMESHAEPGVIQLTGPTAKRLGSRFVTEPRGTIEVKGKGPMKVFALLDVARESGAEATEAVD
jgi:class 3 adenylate cyclase